MSTTISTQPRATRPRVPLAASLAVAGVIAAAGVLGVAWQQSDDSAPSEAPTLRTPTAQEYSQYNYYHHAARPGDGLDGDVSSAPKAQAPTTSGGRVQIGL